MKDIIILKPLSDNFYKNNFITAWIPRNDENKKFYELIKDYEGVVIGSVIDIIGHLSYFKVEIIFPKYEAAHYFYLSVLLESKE
jgi:hypothetical protein